MLNPLKKNIADRAAYRDNADRRRATAKACYDANPRLKCAASKAAYKTNPDKMKALFRDYHASHHSARLELFREYHASHRSARLRYFRKYHSYTKLKRVTEARYSLAQPNQLSIEKFFRNVQVNILTDREVLVKLKEEFKSLHAGVADTLSRAELEQTVGRLSVKRLDCKALENMQGFGGYNKAHLKNAIILEMAAILVVQSLSFMRQPTSMLEIPQYLLMRRGSVLLLKKCLWWLAV